MEHSPAKFPITHTDCSNISSLLLDSSSAIKAGMTPFDINKWVYSAAPIDIMGIGMGIDVGIGMSIGMGIGTVIGMVIGIGIGILPYHIYRSLPNHIYTVHIHSYLLQYWSMPIKLLSVDAVTGF